MQPHGDPNEYWPNARPRTRRRASDADPSASGRAVGSPGRVYGWPKDVFHVRGIPESILDIAAAVREQRGEDPEYLARSFAPAPGFEHIVA